MFLFFLGLGLILSLNLIGQNTISEEEEDLPKLLQFSGMIISNDTTQDNIQPVFYCHIRMKNRRRGTVSNLDGLFSVVAQERDTILFSALGYKPNYLVIPDTLTDNIYSIVHIMETDTFTLAEAVVYPWPTRGNFKREFLKLDIKDDPIAFYEKTFGREIPIEYIPNAAGENSGGATFVVSGPFSAIADFIRDGDQRKLNRYRKKLGILDSVQAQQEHILPKEKGFFDRLKESLPFQNEP